jgi:K(+)-stimulated pyrophosphate-energized sodium pump
MGARGSAVTTTLVPLIAMLAGAAGLAFAWGLFEAVRRQPAGAPALVRLEGLIRTGAMTFLAREYSVLLPFVAVISALLAWAIGWRTALAYAGG